MKIVLTPVQATLVGWNVVENQELIRACFFLGYGDTFIAELVSNHMRSYEADEIILAAKKTDMSDADTVEAAARLGGYITKHRRGTEGGYPPKDKEDKS